MNAAKRVSKKRANPDSHATSPAKKSRRTIDSAPQSPAEIEASLELPTSHLDAEALAKVVVFSNRAPLVLAFVVTLLRYTMPGQPLSSRLSLAQGYVSTTSRSRAAYLGLESGKSAEEEGFGQGQPHVRIMGQDIRVMKRWGYEWKPKDAGAAAAAAGVAAPNDAPAEASKGSDDAAAATESEEQDEPALWALDLEALKKSTESNPAAHVHSSNSSLPIYTPQSARSYIARAFDTPRDLGGSSKKAAAAAAAAADKEKNLGHLLKALDMLYESWAAVLEPAELDRRTWTWYVAVRPAVAAGVAGWGGKNEIKLCDVLDLRRAEEA